MNNFFQRIISIIILTGISIPLVLYVEYGTLVLFVPFTIACLLEYTMICVYHRTDTVFVNRKFPSVIGDNAVNLDTETKIVDIVHRMILSCYFLNIFLKYNFGTAGTAGIFFSFYSCCSFYDITCLLIIVFLCAMNTSDFWANLEETLFGITWILPASMICMIYGMTDPLKLISIFTMTAMGDGGAFLIGKTCTMFFPTHRIFPNASPNKTIEGSLGYILFSLITAYFFSFYCHFASFRDMMVLGFICSIFGQYGDLVESKFKREKGLKDSGMFWNPMSAFQGIMDRCDSIFFALPASYIYLHLL